MTARSFSEQASFILVCGGTVLAHHANEQESRPPKHRAEDRMPDVWLSCQAAANVAEHCGFSLRTALVHSDFTAASCKRSHSLTNPASLCGAQVQTNMTSFRQLAICTCELSE